MLICVNVYPDTLIGVFQCVLKIHKCISLFRKRLHFKFSNAPPIISQPLATTKRLNSAHQLAPLRSSAPATLHCTPVSPSPHPCSPQWPLVARWHPATQSRDELMSGPSSRLIVAATPERLPESGCRLTALGRVGQRWAGARRGTGRRRDVVGRSASVLGGAGGVLIVDARVG